jgi:hypothetical protein
MCDSVDKVEKIHAQYHTITWEPQQKKKVEEQWFTLFPKAETPFFSFLWISEL